MQASDAELKHFPPEKKNLFQQKLVTKNQRLFSDFSKNPGNVFS